MAVVEGTRIHWAFGSIPVERLNDGWPQREDRVTTLRGGRLHYLPPALVPRDDFDCVRIETDTGRELTCTSDQWVYANSHPALWGCLRLDDVGRTVHLSVGLMKGTKVTVKKSPLPLPIKKKGRAYLRRNVPTVGQAVGVAQEVVSEDVFKGYRMVVMLLPPAMQDRRPRMYATKASQLVPGMFVLEANLEYARIVSVTPVQGRPHRVYDVALERTGNYIANGIFLGGW